MEELKIMVIWYVVLCSLGDYYRCFGGTCYVQPSSGYKSKRDMEISDSDIGKECQDRGCGLTNRIWWHQEVTVVLKVDVGGKCRRRKGWWVREVEQEFELNG
jgi:hypothetical protein